MSGPRQQAVGRGFRRLASDIFGDNAPSQTIAMTAPVAQVALTPEPGPRPPPGGAAGARQRGDPLREDRAARRGGAALLGLLDRPQAQAKAEELRGWIAAQGLTVTGGPRFYCYDDPFTLPFNRRNEVAFTLSGAG